MSRGLSTTSFVLDMYDWILFDYILSKIYVLASDEIFDAFLNLSDSFDDLDKEMSNIYLNLTQFVRL